MLIPISRSYKPPDKKPKAMPSAKLVRHAHFRPQDLLNMVADVGKYPEFIDLISQSRVTDKRQIKEGVEQFEADVVISFKFLNETFRSLVTTDTNAMSVKVQKPDRAGALKQLSNHWIFHELSDGSSLIEFEVDVKLKALPLEFLLRDKFDKTSLYIIKKFERRAAEIYTPLPPTALDLVAETKKLGLRAVQV